MVFADSSPTEIKADSVVRRMIVDVVLSAIALTYFAGFMVDYNYLTGLGLSMAATNLPPYYLFAYSFSIAIYSGWYLAGIVVLTSLFATVLEHRRRRRIRNGKTADLMANTFYPSLVFYFVLSVALLFPASQVAAHGQLANLAIPHRSLLTVQLTPSFLKDHRNDLEIRRFESASAEGGLVLAADLKDEVVYVERYPPNVEGTPAIHFYRVSKTAIALSYGSVLP